MILGAEDGHRAGSKVVCLERDDKGYACYERVWDSVIESFPALQLK